MLRGPFTILMVNTANTGTARWIRGSQDAPSRERDITAISAVDVAGIISKFRDIDRLIAIASVGYLYLLLRAMSHSFSYGDKLLVLGFSRESNSDI